MRIIVLKQCQKEIAEFPLSVKEQLSDYLELPSIGEVLMPPAAKALSSIVKGLHELQMKDASGQNRVIYLMRLKDAMMQFIFSTDSKRKRNILNFELDERLTRG